MNEPETHSPQQPRTFSVSTLLILTSVVAVLFGLRNAIGLWVIPVVFIGLFIVVGGLAQNSGLLRPFWAAIGSAVLFVFALPILNSKSPATVEIIFGCIFFGVGLNLAYCSVRDGHWATRWIGLVLVSALAHYWWTPAELTRIRLGEHNGNE